MNADHIPLEAVRAYLLGMLTSGEAAVIEDKYFTDPAFFCRVQTAERSLIEEFLDGRLRGEEKRSFESRYLVVPELKRVMAEVSAGRPVKSSSSRWASWQLAAAAALIAGLGLGTWIYLNQKPGAEPQIASARPDPLERLPTLDMHLTPGVTKGTAKMVSLELPKTPTLVRLVAELPGRPAPVQCSAKLFLLGNEGQRVEVWSGDALHSVAGNGGQELPVAVNSSVLRRGDFILEVATRDGGAETFLFRVTSN